MITIPALILVLIIGFALWWRGTKHQEDSTKAQFFIEYGEDKFKETFGDKEYKRFSGKK